MTDEHTEPPVDDQNLADVPHDDIPMASKVPETKAEVEARIIGSLNTAKASMLAELHKVIIGQDEVIELLMQALMSRGHCLLVGVPGLAKTLLISTLAKVLKLDFSRIQFTPDLMPSDITGTDIIEEDHTTGKRVFTFVKGPLFANIILADEINRTPPKTQSSLLQAMQEYHVTAGRETYDLEPPFFVLATQNPIEQEGTYPLPEAQLDRFMFMVNVDYPSRIPVSQHVVDYAVNLTRATRPDDGTAPEFIKQYLTWGAGPRAAQYLVLGAKSRALLHGRFNVSCEDIRGIAKPVLRHRIFTNFNADAEGVSPDKIVEMLVQTVQEPQSGEYKQTAQPAETPKT